MNSIIAIVLAGVTSIGALVNLNATNEVKKITDDKPTTVIDNSINQTNNYYGETAEDNSAELLNIKDQLNEIKKDISNSERNAKVITYNEKEQKYTSCDQCGEYGAANTDLFKWRDTKGCYHWTHYNCLEDYIARTGNSPTDKITTNYNND